MNVPIGSDDKKKLLGKIHALKNIKHFKNIKSIIKHNSPNVYMMKNNNGIFLDFNNLTDKTYIALDEFVNDIICDSSSKN
jgi:hypothetical protein